MRQWVKLAALLFVADVALGAAVRLVLEVGARAAAPPREQLSERAAALAAELALLEVELRGAGPLCACSWCLGRPVSDGKTPGD